jgi:hypothetical protein
MSVAESIATAIGLGVLVIFWIYWPSSGGQ